MNLTFAKFATLVASEGDAAAYYTDPVSLGDNDRASAIPVTHYYNGPNTPHFIYVTQVSNDGINWVTQGPTEDITVSSTGAQTQKVASVNGSFIRMELRYTVTGGGSDTGAICFDMLVSLDKGDAA